MIKRLQEVVDFTSLECTNIYFKPVFVNGYGGLGVHPIDTVIDDSNLILDYESIPIKDIKHIELGYITEKDSREIEYVHVDTIGEMKKYIDKKRYSNICDSIVTITHGHYFPFYETDKVGGGFAIIETEDNRYGIYYPTKKITSEMEFNKKSEEDQE